MQIDIPAAFRPLFQPSRYKAFYGGRGSAKSHSFATALAIRAAQAPLRILCAREIQKSIKASVKQLIDDKIAVCGLTGFYQSTDTEIRGANGSLFIFAGLRSNPDSIKSMEGLDIAWVEEANHVSRRSLDLLVPTVRKEGSELWFSWNPESEIDPVDMMFRSKTPPPDSIIRQVNYTENPFFPETLRQEMLFDKETDPAKYEHVWLGGYRMAPEGAYYAHLLAQAAIDSRITRVPHDPAVQTYAAFDLGIGDATAIWFAQFVGREIRIIDYIENSGVGIDWYARELRSRPYVYAPLILPHDARARELGTGRTRQEMFESMGFQVKIAPSLSVDDGIEAVRRIIPQMWIDADKCEAGLKALREYREAWDDKLRVSRGPLHDWSSHAADAMRYLAIGYEEQVQVTTNFRRPTSNWRTA